MSTPLNKYHPVLILSPFFTYSAMTRKFDIIPILRNATRIYIHIKHMEINIIYIFTKILYIKYYNNIYF